MPVLISVLLSSFFFISLVKSEFKSVKFESLISKRTSPNLFCESPSQESPGYLKFVIKNFNSYVNVNVHS